MDAALFATRRTRGIALGPLRIAITYLWRHGRLPDLVDPQRFTELVQARKLHDRDMQLPILADKLRVKAVVADRLGVDWIIPTLWHGTMLPLQPPWPRPFVVKSRHSCNQTAFVRTGAEDWAAIAARSRRWMARDYGFWLDEWLYRHIPRGLLVEPFIGSGPDLPVDYKFYVFGGRVECIQVHLGRGARHRWIVFDRSWRRMSSPTADADPPAPAPLAAMIEAAETLGHGFGFVRVDLYAVDDRPRFGELTFYPGSGLDRFDPVGLDQTLGAHWRRALEVSGGAARSAPPAPAPHPCPAPVRLSGR